TTHTRGGGRWMSELGVSGTDERERARGHKAAARGGTRAFTCGLVTGIVATVVIAVMVSHLAKLHLTNCLNSPCSRRSLEGFRRQPRNACGGGEHWPGSGDARATGPRKEEPNTLCP